MKLRINKLLSDAGLGSRRDVEELIREGRVFINGKKATLSCYVEAADEVLLDGIDLPVKELIHEHDALEKIANYEKQKTEMRQKRRARGKATERAESQRISSAPKSAALRKTSKNNPENKRLHKLREAELLKEEQDLTLPQQNKDTKREYKQHSRPRRAFIKKAR